MAKIIIKQVRSTIRRPESQCRTMVALGLHKINQTIKHKVNPQIMGMVNKVKHLVSYEII